MLSSFDITRILAESAASLIGANITGVEYYRKERAVQVYIKSDRRYAVTLSFHPQRNGFYILSAGRSRLETTEKYRPFAREVWDGTVVSLRQIPNDRFVEMEIEAGGKRWYLVFEIIGPNANLWLLDADKRMVASLRQKQFTPGQPYDPASLPEKLDAAVVTVDDLRRLFDDNPDVNPARLLEKNIYGLDYYLARTLWPDEDVPDDEQLEELQGRLRDVVAAYQSPDGTIYAYFIKGRSRYFPIKIAGYEPLEKYKSLSRAQVDVIDGIKEQVETDTLRDRTLKHIQSRIKKLQRLVSRLDTDIEEAADYEKYRQFSDLLKINIGHLKRGLTEIEVDDLYGGPGRVIIPLDPKSTGPENIEAYSKRYRKGKEGLDILQRREQNTAQEIESLTEALAYFENDFETAQHEYPELLPSSSGESPAAAPRLPYKEYQTSTGVTIFVGKTEADNDRLTLEYARPHEMWFHASQCPGSHVVMKYPNKDFEPSKWEIEEAAALAAYYSKARKSAKVPVSYTLKKYVRKPRGAKPGLVTIQMEKTILVEPREIAKKE